MDNTRQVIEEIIEEVIQKQGTGIISSVDEQGYPNTKAMLVPRIREGIKYFYFTTNTSSMRVAQYKKNNKACLYFADNSTFRGIMFRGTMEVLEDHDSKAKVWRDGDTMYYSEGVDDPDYAVLRFTAEDGRFYTNFSSHDFTV